MKITFLGTGTSHGVPMIGCDCPVCKSTDPRNNRTRCSAIVQVNDVNLLIDTPPEFRMQALREDIRRVDAVLFTHAHADHVFGLDDIRRYNDILGRAMPCCGNKSTLDTIRTAFDYVFRPIQIGGGLPSLELIEAKNPLTMAGVSITPIPIMHGRMHILGYRIGNFAYVTDCSSIPDSSMELLKGLHTLVLGVIRHEPHETHFNVKQGLALAGKLAPAYTFFTHIAHKLDHEKTNATLPANVQLAYDGMQWEVTDGV